MHGCCYCGFVGKDDGFCDTEVAREETPVDVCAVADVGVVVVCGGLLEDFLDEGLVFCWVFEEELDDCCQDLELCL